MLGSGSGEFPGRLATVDAERDQDVTILAENGQKTARNNAATDFLPVSILDQ
jgi:hypothetical protein